MLVSNYRECFRFYRDVLGSEIEWDDEESRYADFETGDATPALFDWGAIADAVGATNRPDWGIRVAHYRDPDDTLVEISRSLDG